MERRYRKSTINIIKEYGPFVSMLLAYVLFLGAANAITSFQEGTGTKRAFYLFILLTLICAAISSFISTKIKDNKIVIQECPIYLFVGVLFGLFAIRTRDYFNSISYGAFDWSLLFISTVCILLFIYLLIYLIKSNEVTWINLQKKIINNIVIVILVAVCFFLAINMLQVQPRWDSVTTMHHMVDDVRYEYIFNYNNTALSEHSSQAYAGIITIISAVVGDIILAHNVVHIFLYLLSLVAIYRIVIFLNDGKILSSLITTSIWAFSPFVLGLVGYYSYDICLIYLMPVVFCAYIYKEWFFFFFFIILSCYTKETFVPSLFGLSCGILVVEIFIRKKLIAEVLRQKRWYSLAVIAFFWLLFYIKMISRKESSVVHTYFVKDTAIQNLKIFYLLNFNWVFLMIIVVSLIYFIKNKQREQLELYIPLITCDIFTVGLYMVLSTVTLSRYMDAHLGCLYIMTIISLLKIENKKIKCAAQICLGILLLISNLRVIDPMSWLAFNSHDYGNEKLITTQEELGDGIVYNQQYIFFDMALNEALDGCTDSLIFFPEISEGVLYNFEGKYANMYTGYESKGLWDDTDKQRVVFSSDGCKEFWIYNVFSADNILKEIKDKDGYFFCMPCIGYDILEELNESGVVEETTTFSKGPFKITRAKISANLIVER